MLDDQWTQAALIDLRLLSSAVLHTDLALGHRDGRWPGILQPDLSTGPAEKAQWNGSLASHDARRYICLSTHVRVRHMAIVFAFLASMHLPDHLQSCVSKPCKQVSFLFRDQLLHRT